MAEFFIADTHFYHKNVLKFENRAVDGKEFESIEDMNDYMIDNWNKVVGHRDIVHHLGDFSFGKPNHWEKILRRLNGRIILYRGNHDDRNTVNKMYKLGFFEDYFKIGDSLKMRSEETGRKYQVWLTHYPMQIGERINKFSVSGHIHSEPNIHLNQLNVGVDSQLMQSTFCRELGEPVSKEGLIHYMDVVTEHLVNEREKEDKLKND